MLEKQDAEIIETNHSALNKKWKGIVVTFAQMKETGTIQGSIASATFLKFVIWISIWIFILNIARER